MLDRIKQLATAYAPRIVAIRQQLHSQPELAYHEVKTAALIQAVLTELDIPYTPEIAQTGIVALIHGQAPESRCIALRADMDALPIQELNTIPYCSTVDGQMHACGHDVHTANLLGAAMILMATRDAWQGTVKLIFQPSEEKSPSGAAAMIAAGVLANPKVDAIIGLHVHPELEAGEVGLHAGSFMASADELYITVIGRGGHAAQPQHFISPLLMASEIILQLSAYTDLAVPLVLSLGKIEALGATNIIPNRAEIGGTLRCFDEQVRQNMHQTIRDTCQSIAARYGGSVDVNIIIGNPVLTNNTTLTELATTAAKSYLGDIHVHQLPIRMGAEDFAYYSQLVPACFYRIGTGNKAMGITSPIHTPTFDIDERALETSIGLMSWIAMQWLANPDTI
jgi:amidohydrolase